MTVNGTLHTQVLALCKREIIPFEVLRETTGCVLIISPSFAETPFDDDPHRTLCDEGRELCAKVANEYDALLWHIENYYHEDAAIFLCNPVYAHLTLDGIFRGTFSEFYRAQQLMKLLGSRDCDLRQFAWYAEMKEDVHPLSERIKYAYSHPDEMDMDDLYEFLDAINEELALPDCPVKVISIKEPLPSLMVLHAQKNIPIGLYPCQSFILFYNGSRIVWARRFIPEATKGHRDTHYIVHDERMYR